MIRSLAVLVCFAAACNRGTPITTLPLSKVATNIDDVKFELVLPEGVKELTPAPGAVEPGAGHGERSWERTSASETIQVTVQVGTAAKLENALKFETMKSGSVLRRAQLADGYSMTTSDTSQRAIALEDRGLYCTALLTPKDGKPSAEQLDYLDVICGSLKLQAN